MVVLIIGCLQELLYILILAGISILSIIPTAGKEVAINIMQIKIKVVFIANSQRFFDEIKERRNRKFLTIQTLYIQHACSNLDR